MPEPGVTIMRTILWPLRLIGLLWLAAGCLSAAHAQQPLAATFKPDLPIFPQYFSVEQHSDGKLYLGYSGGIARFDGVRWVDIKLPGGGPVRELHRDRNGRIWVGGTNYFGYLVRNDDGSDRFVDLASSFPLIDSDAPFADIWRMLERDDGIYFGALHHLFHVDFEGKPVQMWTHDGRFGAMAEVEGELWVQWRGQGLKKLVNGDFQPVTNGAQFSSPLLYNMLPLPDGRILMHSTTPYVGLWENGELTELPLLKEHPALPHLVSGRVVSNHVVAFGGDDGIVRMVDLEEGSLQPLPLSKSFISDLKLGLEGAMLTASDEGIMRLRWPVSLTAYAGTTGIRGYVNKFHATRQHFYALSQSGVYVTNLRNGEPALPFERLDWTGNEGWDLLPTDSGLLLAASQGLRTASTPGAPRTGPEALYPRILTPDPANADLIWLGTEHGPALLRRINNQWVVADQIKHLGAQISSVAAAGDSAAWFGSGDYGLFLVRLSEATQPKLEFVSKGTDLGLDLGSGTRAVVSNTRDGTLVSTQAGVYRWDGSQFVADDLGGFAELNRNRESVTFKDGRLGELWAFDFQSLYRRTDGQWSVYDLAGLGLGAFTTFEVLPHGDIWVGGASVLLRIDPAYLPKAPAGVRLDLAGVSVQKGNGTERLSLQGSLDVRNLTGPITFQFGLTDFEQAGSAEFQYRLGEESITWSEWTPRADVVYNTLSPGDYELQMRARTSTGQIVSAGTVNFAIIPRWYEHLAAKVAAAVGVLITLIGLLQLRNRRRLALLSTRNRELDEMVKARTTELEEANAKLQTQATRDGLTGLANRRLFDTKLASAMAGARVCGDPLSLLMIDVDHFKQFNDTRGHQAGDVLLQKLAVALGQSVRGDTVVARYGGEEFAVIAERCDRAAADRLSSRMVMDVEQALKIATISVGVAAFDDSRDERPEDLIQRADQALYQAKHNGRNRAVMAA